MPLMNIFEPLFLLLALTAVLTILTAGAFAAAGRFARAGRLLRRLAIGAAAYFAVVISASIVNPRRVYEIGDPQCFDDWCITVADARRTPAPAGVSYQIALRLTNRARRAPMGEKGTVVYLTDAKGRRYDPLADPHMIPLDVVVQPGESVVAARSFDLPGDASDVALVYTHEGGFPIGWLIIAEGGWFQKPSIVRLN